MVSHDSVMPIDRYASINLFVGLIIIVIAHLTTKALRQVYFHPLSKFPGPLLAKISNLPLSKSYLSGRQPYNLRSLHEKYGPVVRVAPSELSFSSAQSWQDIYGARPGRHAYTKSLFYEGGCFANEALSIVSERDHAKHRDMRRYLSKAFSERALKEQEYLLTNVIDRFIERIGEARTDPLDMTLWFNLLTFDIIGELAFGESFGGIESGSMHFWVAVVVSSMGQSSLSDTLARFPLLGRIYVFLKPGWLKQLTEGARKHESYTIQMVEKWVHDSDHLIRPLKSSLRRMKEKSDRKDFMTSLLEEDSHNEHRVTTIQLAAHASDLVIAGSETTATALATITWYLAHSPEILAKLQHEIRSNFQTYSQINAQSTSGLQYLHGVCLEALRVYPPLPLGLPRIVPEGGGLVDGHYIPDGTTVSTNPFAASMSSENFKEPWKFAPARWIGRNKDDNLDASQPFSVGPRACLGRNLAWIELHTTLAKMHFKYDLELLNMEMDWQRDSEMHLLWKKPPLMMKIHHRDIIHYD